MNIKVKRGLGLLVVAVIALIVGNVVMAAKPESDFLDTVQSLAVALSALVMAVAFVVGLALIAWGLLRE